MSYKSKRSKACEFSKKERQVIYERDNYSCIFCNNTFALGIAHVFYSRAYGGLGVKENGVLACEICHRLLDFGNREQRTKYQERAQQYLLNHYPNLNIENLKFQKGAVYV